MSTEVSTITTARLENGLPSALDEGETDKSSAGLSSQFQKSSAAMVDPKVCGVCGDKALGNNFNAITCESCKAFFRRNALRTKEFVCPFNNNCKVDAITRRFCQRCRLKKCFDIGMKKEWIMTDEEKKIKKQKIEQNRKKRSSLENSGGIGESSPQGDDDGDSEDSPPAAKKSHISTESQHVDHQQLTGSVSAVSRVITNETDIGNTPTVIGEIGSGVISDESAPKVQKQPMGLHNQKQNSSRRKYSRQVKDGKGKSSSSVIPIQISTPSHIVAASAPSSPILVNPHQQQHQFNSSVTDPSQHHDFHQQQHCGEKHVRQQETSHNISQQAGALSAIWMECDSSNSSLSPPTPNSQHVNSQSKHCHQPPPLIKYPPNKRPRVYEHHESIEENLEAYSASNDQSTPLLSSLIHPSYPESSPDHATSPPAPQSVDNHSNGDENEVHHHRHQNSISYHRPSASSSDSLSPHHQVLHHDHRLQHSQHQSFQNEYERSSPSQPHSPSMLASYQNGYHHHYSPPYSVDSDNHAHHHHHHSYQDNAQRRNHHQQEQNQQVSMRMPSLNTMDSILSIAIAAEFNSFGMLGNNIPNSKDLNKAEQAKLNELLLASQALHAPVDAERPIPKESGSSDPSLLNVINLTEIAIRRLIKMSKKISGFKNMCQEDQIALLKGSCTEMMILRSVVTYDPDRDSWQIPHSNPGYNINLGVLKEARGNLYEEHQRFVKSFRSQWRKDENIMIILCAITLFTPERHNVIHRDVVKLEQDSYYYLLKRYLESILNGCEAKSNYLQLIHKIAELRALNSSHVRAYLEMNPKEVEPLLIEIFDLK